jgi:hypothetical protein
MYNSLSQKLKTDIVPWALPREEIPLNVKWPKELTFDKIRLVLQDNLALKELLNVQEFQSNDNTIENSLLW